ncbi:nuclear transport factor 2 family protein [Parafrankia sp. FMc6]|uniref:nuclear transport factor 2 family protein n=1 Tax=Parafrankia soli TaxID=2599596 RepID=UPI0034D61248
MDIQELSDKIEITELLARYARGVDARDWDLWKTVFTPEAIIDYSSAGAVVGSRDEVASWLEKGLAAVPMTQHFISNVEIVLNRDRAKVRAMFYNPMHLPGMDQPSFCGGYYHHDMVRTEVGWRSERLVEENQWFVNPLEPPLSR